MMIKKIVAAELQNQEEINITLVGFVDVTKDFVPQLITLHGGNDSENWKLMKYKIEANKWTKNITKEEK